MKPHETITKFCFFVTNMYQLPLVKSQDIDQVPQASAKALFRRQRLEKPAPCPH